MSLNLRKTDVIFAPRQPYPCTPSDEGHTVFEAMPKVSSKSYTSIKEIQLYRQTEDTGTYHIANKKSQRRHGSNLQDNDRQRQNRQGAVFFYWQTAAMDYEATA